MKKIAVISATPENWSKFETTYQSDILFDKLKNIITLYTKRGEADCLVTSMNIGLETMAAQIALALREETGLKLECALPFEEQAKYFSEPNRDRYFDIVSACDTETLIDTKRTNQSRIKCYKYMIESSDIIIVGLIGNVQIERLLNQTDKQIIRMDIGA